MSRSSGFAWDETFTASGDLGSNQYYFVRQVKSQARYVQAASCASGPMPLGILQNDPRDGEAATVRLLGISKCVAGAAITVGDFVMAASTGKGEIASGSCANAVALTTAAAGETIDVLLGVWGGQLMGSAALPDNTP